MRNARSWPQQRWKNCASASSIAALRFGDHGAKEMLAQKLDRFQATSKRTQQLPTLPPTMLGVVG